MQKLLLVIIISSLILGILTQCNPYSDDHKMVIDMSGEMESGYFNPDRGDRVFLAGSFNEWQTDALELHHLDSTTYGVALDNVFSSPVWSDTVAFKFVLDSGDDRILPNNGWETLPNREMEVAELYDNEDIFEYNHPLGSREEATVTFSVNMSNQQVLGFFKPEKGDQVIVTGDFLDWDPHGLPLEPVDEYLYKLTLPVSNTDGPALAYKYRILTNREAALPEDGWERTGSHRLELTEEQLATPEHYFGNMKRVGRFIVNASRPGTQQNNELRLIIELDGNRRIYPLMQVGEGVYETGVVIPPEADEMAWSIKGESKEIEWSNVEIPETGKVIRSKLY